MGETNQYGPFYITAENLTSRSAYAFSNFDFGIYNFMEDSFNIYGIYNFMEDSFNIYSASYRIGTYIY